MMLTTLSGTKVTLVEKNSDQINKTQHKSVDFFVDLDVLIWVFLNTKLLIF